jgi:lipopolysaccharide export system protein LptA
LDHADANENVYNNSTGDFTSHLRGDVRFRYEEISISADEAVWQKAEGIIDFRGNITVEEKGQVMTCDRLHFVRDSSVLTASGNVLYQDSAKITFMRGRTAEYATNKKECTLIGSPLLTRVDSTSADTLFIRGRTMVYSDSLKIATVAENVRITRGDLVATCRNAKYYVDDNYAKLRVNPVINYEKHKIVGDSVDLFFSDEKFEGACVMGNTHGHYSEIADSSKDTTVTDIWSDSLYLSMYESGKVNAMKAFGSARGKYSEVTAQSGSVTSTDLSSDSLHMYMLETGKVSAIKAFGKAHGRNAEWSAAGAAKDSLITHIWGDSLRVRMSDAGKIRSMRAFGNVLSKNFAAGDSARTNEVSGRTMMLTFGADGKVERAIVRGEARSTYYIDEADGGGCNSAGGEQIVVTFSRGKAQRLHVKGGAKGMYFP